MTAALGLVAPLFLATAKKTSSTNPTLFIFIAIAAAFYFLIYRPQQRKAKVAREVTKNFDVGDEVLTAGGIVGHIIDIDGDRVTLETSVGASFVVLKQYVLRKLEEPGSAGAGELPDEDHDEHDGADDHEADDELADDTSDSSGDGAGEAEAPAPEADPAPSNRSRRVRRAKGSDIPDDDGGPDGPPII
jgi:preprotein translocase subunit YajC